MKLKLTILLSLLIYVSSFAQKVDLDRIYVSYEYTALPSKPFPIEYKTFNVTASSTGSTSNFISNSEMEDKVYFSGFQKIGKEAKSDLSVFVNFGDFIIDNAEVKERVEISKDKEGKETGRTYYYWVEVLYSFSGSVKLVNNVLGKEIENYSLQSSSTKLTYKSDEYGKRDQAAGYWNNNRVELKGQLATKEIKAKLSELSEGLTRSYGYKLTKNNYTIWYLGEKKHPEYELNSKIVAQYKLAVESIKANQPIKAEMRDSFKPVIDYFNDVKARFNKNEKADKKMRYSAFYNLGFIYNMLEDYPNAAKEAEGLAANDYDKSDSKDILRDSKYAEEQLKTNNTNTRHFVNLRLPADKL